MIGYVPFYYVSFYLSRLIIVLKNIQTAETELLTFFGGSGTHAYDPYDGNLVI